MRDDIKVTERRGRKCTTVLHGGVCHRTSISHKSDNKTKKKIIILTTKKLRQHRGYDDIEVTTT